VVEVCRGLRGQEGRGGEEAWVTTWSVVAHRMVKNFPNSWSGTGGSDVVEEISEDISAGVDPTEGPAE
jgi:hypothetical protein